VFGDSIYKLVHLFVFSIAKSAWREAEKDYHFGISGSFSNYYGHTARFRVLGEIGDPLPNEKCTLPDKENMAKKKNGWHLCNQQCPLFICTTALFVIQETTSTSTQAKGTS